MTDLHRAPAPSASPAAGSATLPIDVPPLSPTAVPTTSPMRSRRSSRSSSSAHTPGTELATSPLGGIALPGAVAAAKTPTSGVDELGFASLASLPPPPLQQPHAEGLSPGRLRLTLTLPSPRPCLGRAQSSNAAVVTPTQTSQTMFIPLPPPTCTDSNEATAAAVAQTVTTRRRSSPRTISDPLPPRPVLPTSVSYSEAGPSADGSTLQSTPTAELGPFEYPVPDPESKAGKRAAAVSPGMLPASTDLSPMGGRQTESYFSPPRLSLAFSPDDKAAVAEACAAAAAAAAASGRSPSPSSPVLGTSPKRVAGPPASMRPRAATTSRTRSGSISHSHSRVSAAVVAATAGHSSHHAHSGHGGGVGHGTSTRLAHRHGSIAFPVTPVPAPIPPSLLARSNGCGSTTSAGALAGAAGTSPDDASGMAATPAGAGSAASTSRRSSTCAQLLQHRPVYPGSRKTSH